jgi:multidrug efflux system outer membrane protein
LPGPLQGRRRSFLTTLDSERTYYAARQDLVSVRLERQTNAVELFRALGGGV